MTFDGIPILDALPKRTAGPTLLNVAVAVLITALEITLFVVGTRHTAQPPLPNSIPIRIVTLPAAAQAIPADAMPMIETFSVSPSQPIQPPPAQPPSPQPPPEAMRAIETEAPSPPRIKPVPKTQAAPPAAVPIAKPTPPHRVAGRPAREPTERTAQPIVAPPSPTQPRSPSPSGGTMGARAIYRPMLEIPEELRRHPVNLVAVARFRVGADGGADVQLITVTPSPLLNRALLATLRTWRFFPAMQNGRPIASTIEIKIPLEVR